MIVQNVKCDICGAAIDTHGGGRVDLHAHDMYQVMLPVYPPKNPGLFDLCDKCRSELTVWINDRMYELGIVTI